MAYVFNDLVSLHMGPAGSRVFRYSTADAASVVQGAGYFNSASGLLAVGDVIMTTVALGGTPQVKTYVVTAVSSAGVVTIALQTTVA